MKTLEELEKLPDDELRVMLAELIGWRCERVPNENADGPTVGSTPRWRRPGDARIAHYLPTLPPNYPGDLNSTAAVEASLRGMKAFDYTKAIKEQVMDNAFELITATARQRAIALILTLQ